MGYLHSLDETWGPGALGCGPDCKCGRCRAKFAGFGEHYIPADENEEDDPEQAPPEEGAPDEQPEPPMQSASQTPSGQSAPPGAASSRPRMPRMRRMVRRRQRAPRLGAGSYTMYLTEPLRRGETMSYMN